MRQAPVKATRAAAMTPMDKSKPKLIFASPEVISAMAAKPVNMTLSMIKPHNNRAQFPSFLNPSSRCWPVAWAYSCPKRKVGYFMTNARTMNNSKSIPNKAPARVDCTRWETPMQTAAKSRPGPRMAKNRRLNLMLRTEPARKILWYQKPERYSVKARPNHDLKADEKLGRLEKPSM